MPGFAEGCVLEVIPEKSKLIRLNYDLLYNAVTLHEHRIGTTMPSLLAD